MIRKMSIAILAAAALAGCATGYGYRGGSGDYYYGRGGGYDSYDYGSYYGYGGYGHGYGAPYRYYGGGYGYPYSYYDYPYYGYPYYYTRPPRHDDDDRPDHVDRSQRRHPYPGLPDKSGVDRGPLTVGPPAGIGDAGRSRIRDLREPRPARQAGQPVPTVRPSLGRPVRALTPQPPAARRAPVSRPVQQGSEVPRRSAPAQVRIEAPRRSAPAPVRSESPRREAPSRLRDSERRVVPL